MFSNSNSVRHLVAALAIGLAIACSAPALGQDAMTSAEDTYTEIESMLGGVPSFVKMYPKAGVAGAWALTRDLSFGQTTLDPMTKALISLAVAAQIPCQYCIWSDTRDASAAGASDEQIAEAVAVAALTRHWSTVFNGLQVDFDQYKMELGGE